VSVLVSVSGSVRGLVSVSEWVSVLVRRGADRVMRRNDPDPVVGGGCVSQGLP